MTDIWSSIESNLGAAKESVILLLTLLGVIIISAKEWRIALATGMLLFGVEFVAFYLGGWNYLYAFIAFIFCMVVLIVSIFLSYERKRMVV